MADGIFDEALWCENGGTINAKASSRADTLRNFALRCIDLRRVGKRSFHKPHDVKSHMLFIRSVCEGKRSLWERRATLRIQANVRRCLARFMLKKLRRLRIEKIRQSERNRQLVAQRRDCKLKMMQLRRHCAMTLQSRVRGWRLRTQKRALQIRIRDEDFAYRDPDVVAKCIKQDKNWDYMRGACVRASRATACRRWSDSKHGDLELHSKCERTTLRLELLPNLELNYAICFSCL